MILFKNSYNLFTLPLLKFYYFSYNYTNISKIIFLDTKNILKFALKNYFLFFSDIIFCKIFFNEELKKYIKFYSIINLIPLLFGYFMKNLLVFEWYFNFRMILISIINILECFIFNLF